MCVILHPQETRTGAAQEVTLARTYLHVAASQHSPANATTRCAVVSAELSHEAKVGLPTLGDPKVHRCTYSQQTVQQAITAPSLQ